MKNVRQHPVYRVLTLVLLLAASAFLFQLAAQTLTAPRFLFYDDFIEYWSAGRLNLRGNNPYDPAQLEELQHQVGRVKNTPLMMWNPPWTLTLVMPFGIFSYPVSRVLWLLLNIVIVFFCADWVWRYYGGARRRRWLAWTVTFSFGPLLYLLKAGQISLLLLLGGTSFLYFVDRERYFAAGAALALLTIKPHLLYLVGWVALLWCVYERKWRMLLGGALALLLMMGVAWGINLDLVSQYTYALAHYPPAHWATPTLGAVLRFMFGADEFWLQFVPPIVGGLWAIGYGWRHRKSWTWREHMPLLLLVSVLTTAYGWTFDNSVSLLSLLPIALAFSRTNWRSGTLYKIGLLMAYLLVNYLVLFTSKEQFWYWWLASFFLGWYLLAGKVLRLDRSTST